MNSQSSSPLASKEYHLLFWMYQHQTNTVSGQVVKFSQTELATECGVAAATINKWLATLRKTKCVDNPKRGKYLITDTGLQVIAKMTEIENLVGGQRDGH